MKKTLLAAALLAGFAGAAHAQSSVTLYGIVDAGLNYTKVSGENSKLGIDSGNQYQSRLGVRGSEDLGNGLKAIFNLENGFTVDNGNSLQGGKLWGRYAYVGLDSATLGRLTLGRTVNLQYAWAANTISPFGLGWGNASVRNTLAYNDYDLNGGQVNNSAYYYSPVVYGFQGAVGYSFANDPNAESEVAGASRNNRLIDLGLKYSNGPLQAVVTYQYLNPSQATPNNGKFKNLTLGANYDFGVVAVYAGYANAKGIRNPGTWNTSGAYAGTGYASGATSANFTKDNAWTLGLSAPLGPGKAYAAYQKATQSKVKGFALGYVYDLSKRTNLYTYFAQNELHDWTANKSLDARQFAVGLQHRF